MECYVPKNGQWMMRLSDYRRHDVKKQKLNEDWAFQDTKAGPLPRRGSAELHNDNIRRETAPCALRLGVWNIQDFGGGPSHKWPCKLNPNDKGHATKEDLKTYRQYQERLQGLGDHIESLDTSILILVEMKIKGGGPAGLPGTHWTYAFWYFWGWLRGNADFDPKELATAYLDTDEYYYLVKEKEKAEKKLKRNTSEQEAIQALKNAKDELKEYEEKEQKTWGEYFKMGAKDNKYSQGSRSIEDSDAILANVLTTLTGKERTALAGALLTTKVPGPRQKRDYMLIQQYHEPLQEEWNASKQVDTFPTLQEIGGTITKYPETSGGSRDNRRSLPEYERARYARNGVR